MNQDKVDAAKDKYDKINANYDELSSKRMKSKADKKELDRLKKQMKHQRFKASGGKEGPHWNNK